MLYFSPRIGANNWWENLKGANLYLLLTLSFRVLWGEGAEPHPPRLGWESSAAQLSAANKESKKKIAGMK